MTTEHGWATDALDYQLQRQVDRERLHVSSNGARLRVSNGNYYVPDVAIVPLVMVRRLLELAGTFEVYGDPVPFVAEVWSPSTSRYDLRTKLRGYQLRGDKEIWLVHPNDRSVRVYRLQSDNQAASRYDATLHQGGIIALAALPDVLVDIDGLFP